MLPGEIETVTVEAIEQGVRGAAACIEQQVRDPVLTRIPDGARIVSIDGWAGAGKTTIGRIVASALGAALVDLDDHLVREQGSFLDSLRLPEVVSAIADGLAGSGHVVVTGCMVDLVLERAGFIADFRVYVVRISGMVSVPEYESLDRYEELCGEKTADKLIAEQEASARRFAKYEGRPVEPGVSALPGLAQELIGYHKSRRPHFSANLIVRVKRLS